MARKFLTNIDLNTNELQNAVIQNLSSAPTGVEGRIYFDTTSSTLKVYRNHGTSQAPNYIWENIALGSSATSAITIQGSVLGSANVNPDTGRITLNVVLADYIDNAGAEWHVRKNEYWYDSTSQQGIVAGLSDGTFDITATSADLRLESNHANVQVNASNNIVLNPSGIIDATAAELHSKKIELWDNGQQYGILADNSGNLKVTSVSGDLDLESHSGTINLQANLIDANNTELHLAKTEYWNNGTQYGIITNNGNEFKIVSQQGDLVLDSHGTVTAQADTLQIVDSNGNVNFKVEKNGTTGFGNGPTTTIRGTINLVNANTQFVAYEATSPSDTATFVIDADGLIGLEGNGTRVEQNLIVGGVSNYGSQSSNNGHFTVNDEGNNAAFVVDASNYNVLFTNGSNNILTIAPTGTNNQDVILTANQNNLVLNADNWIVTQPALHANGGVVTATVSNAAGITIQSTGSNVDVTADGDIILTAAGTVVVNNNLKVTNDVEIDGNLNVKGTLTAINKQEIDITDNTIVLNSNFTTGTPSQDAAITVKRGSANDVNVVWSEGNKDWTLTNDGNNYFAIARKFVASVGDASNTSFDIVHNLGTRDVTVQVYTNSSTYDVVETDIQMKDNNTVTVGFTVAPALNAYRVVIVG